MGEDQARAPLLQPLGDFEAGGAGAGAATTKGRVRRAALEWWVESKKLWHIVGPAIFQRIALYGINVVTQAFIGHLGDLELAAFSIAATVVAGFNFGFLVRVTTRASCLLIMSLLCMHARARAHAFVAAAASPVQLRPS